MLEKEIGSIIIFLFGENLIRQRHNCPDIVNNNNSLESLKQSEYYHIIYVNLEIRGTHYLPFRSLVVLWMNFSSIQRIEFAVFPVNSANKKYHSKI